jgi:anti-sigma factor RsiW
MKHGQVQRCLLRLLDGELSPPQEAAVRQHLAGCPACAQRLVQLEQLWTGARRTAPLEAPAFFATRVAGRVRESERAPAGFTRLGAIGRQLARRALLLGLAIGAIGLGVFLGGTPRVDATAPMNRGPSYLDPFDDLPAGSVGGVHATLAGASE